MADRPILFSAPMVRALIDGRKTQTRRVLKGAPKGSGWHCDMRDGIPWFVADAGTPSFPAPVRMKPGDRLWVRERWRTTGAFEDLRPSEMTAETTRVKYLADGFVDNRGKPFDHFHDGRHRQAMHMPRWASRLTLIVTDVRVERLQDISEADALSEGIICENVIVGMSCYGGMPHEETADRFFFEGCDDDGFEDGVSAYAALWDRINGTGAWEANPWVAAYTFRVIKSNIDQIGGDA